jgi:hypothetical protein
MEYSENFSLSLTGEEKLCIRSNKNDINQSFNATIMSQKGIIMYNQNINAKRRLGDIINSIEPAKVLVSTSTEERSVMIHHDGVIELSRYAMYLLDSPETVEFGFYNEFLVIGTDIMNCRSSIEIEKCGAMRFVNSPDLMGEIVTRLFLDLREHGHCELFYTDCIEFGEGLFVFFSAKPNATLDD